MARAAVMKKVEHNEKKATWFGMHELCTININRTNYSKKRPYSHYENQGDIGPHDFPIDVSTTKS